MDGPLVKSGLIRGCINCTGKQFKHLIKGEEAPSDLTLFRPGRGGGGRLGDDFFQNLSGNNLI